MVANRPQTVLRYLSELAPTGRVTTDVVHRTSEFAHLGWRPGLIWARSAQRLSVKKSDDMRRLAALDVLHSAERLLRIGWLFVVGTVQLGGKPARFCLPLLSVPVRITDGGFQYRVVHDGDVEMPEDFFDEDARAELEESEAPYALGVVGPVTDGHLARLPKVNAWIADALRYAGLPVAKAVGPDPGLLKLRSQAGLKVVASAAVYTVRDVAAPNVQGSLLSWASRDLAGAAFDVLYGADPVGLEADSTPIASPLPLNARQRLALERSRAEAITVVSGPPGTGKSHLVAAAAIDEVARGNSVLVATQSDYAVGVIADLLERHPGPRFVRFGRRTDRESVAAELSDGLAQPLTPFKHRELEKGAERAGALVDKIRRSIGNALQRELAFGEGLAQRGTNLLIAAQAPGVLAEDFDLSRAERLLHRSQSAKGLAAGWRRRLAERRLRELVVADKTAAIEDLVGAVGVAAAEASVRRGLSAGGLVLDRAWLELEKAEGDWRAATGVAIEAERRSTRNTRRRSALAVGTLASALRAGVVVRRRLLAGLSGKEFLDVLPLWIGTLQEIDNTLPVVPGMFDVVILDEASQIDQMRAGPALARAKRAMVVGDPRQLRHVSFVSDEAMRDAAEQNELSALAARLLDVRRNSLFDAAASVSDVTWLDEHFRSLPHIVGFSDRKFYGGNLRLMTQHPRTETRDAIRTVVVEGDRDKDGVNQVEVATVLDLVHELAKSGEQSIGVVTPFRAQADAIEERLVESFGPEEAERLGLRVGTVHAFQGNEREVVVASLALTADDAGGSLRFLQNPNLFNVLVTRARREMVVVTSIEPNELRPGLLSEYLRYAEHPPLPSENAGKARGWPGELFRELAAFGLTVGVDYPVAGWMVDLVVGSGGDAFGVQCQIHPGGVETHIEQYLALRRAGWDLVDAYQSRWLAEPEGAARMLSERALRSQT